MSTTNEIPYDDFPRNLKTVALITRVMKATRLNYSDAYDLVSADAPMDFASTANWNFEGFTVPTVFMAPLNSHSFLSVGFVAG